MATANDTTIRINGYEIRFVRVSRGYWQAQVNGRTICCCRGLRSARLNAEFLATRMPPAMFAKLIA